MKRIKVHCNGVEMPYDLSELASMTKDNNGRFPEFGFKESKEECPEFIELPESTYQSVLEARVEDLQRDNDFLLKKNGDLKAEVKKLEYKNAMLRDIATANKIEALNIEILKYKEIIDCLKFGQISVADWMHDYMLDALEEKIDSLEAEKAKLRMRGF